MVVIYADSSLKEACVVDGDYPRFWTYKKPVTNNVGEYKAVLLALKWARFSGYKTITILSDSQLIVEQVNGNWKCKMKHLLPLRDTVREGMKFFSSCELKWISREQNLAGKVLEKR